MSFSSTQMLLPLSLALIKHILFKENCLFTFFRPTLTCPIFDKDLIFKVSFTRHYLESYI